MPMLGDGGGAGGPTRPRSRTARSKLRASQGRTVGRTIDRPASPPDISRWRNTTFWTSTRSFRKIARIGAPKSDAPGPGQWASGSMPHHSRPRGGGIRGCVPTCASSSRDRPCHGTGPGRQTSPATAADGRTEPGRPVTHDAPRAQAQSPRAETALARPREHRHTECRSPPDEGVHTGCGSPT